MVANAGNQTIKALCDHGSQVNLISATAVRRLGLIGKPSAINLIGVGGSSLGKSLQYVLLRIRVPGTEKLLVEKFHIVKRVTYYRPSVNLEEVKEFNALDLADPGFREPSKIDALLGIRIWIQIIQPQLIKAHSGFAAAQKTSLGWVIFQIGSDPYLQESPYVGEVTIQDSVIELNNTLLRFWELENCGSRTFQTDEEQRCEAIFTTTHQRDNEGRYIVNIPFNDKITSLGRTKRSVIRQFFAIEQKMQRNEQYAQNYRKFMEEYEELHHMTKVNEDKEDGYYTPHHGVQSSSKFRVVFNASYKSSSGISLNEAQLVGPKIQPDLADILVRFRKFKFGLTADIEKMYRQILVTDNHRKYQKIIWRSKPSDPLSVYQLNTVTYGQAAAPHCAIRALNQCAIDNEKKFPKAAEIVKECFYVDDLITGADSKREVDDIKKEVSNLLAKGQFKLAKWSCTNEDTEREVEFDDQELKSVLGLRWNVNKDVFTYKIQPIRNEQNWTKRKILSEIGKLYDPNGFLAPIIIEAKIFMQQLWKDGFDWDQPLPLNIEQYWTELKDSLHHVAQVSIPRWLGIKTRMKIQMHGFSDASEKAYAAVVFVRSISPDGNVRIGFVASKTRVAPLKRVTIPRLELCAANLLMELEAQLLPSFSTQVEKIFNWSDSQIVLHWLRKSPGDLKIFVANRIANIQEKSTTSNAHWKWISGKDNPADLASRGVRASELINNQLWWNGPSWLGQAQSSWPDLPLPGDIETTEEEKVIHQVIIKPKFGLTRSAWFRHRPTEPVSILDAYSNWTKLVRIMAYILRAIGLFRKTQSSGQLTPEELEAAAITLIRMDQKNTFTKHPNDSKELGKIVAFRDHELDILRVDGRIRSDNLSKDEQAPMLLTSKGSIAKLLILNAHAITMHGGTQQVLQLLRRRFWIIGARKLAQSIIHQCKTCFRHRMTTQTQQMAALPINRTTPAKAFLRTGVDYCGPVEIRSKLGKFPTITKAYISVFICLVTRAIHLELVSDLTSDAFLAALRRFMARRGRVTDLLSDNGTNFVGAHNFMQRIINSAHPNQTIAEQLNLRWKFITPAAPHHGGIYEAAVKSAKKHLIRVIGDQKLTFEEYATLLTQVEACLNSRPLSPLSDDATDLNALTPAHFLIGEPIITLPEPANLLEPPKNLHKRWDMIQHLHQSFWKRWRDEYIMGLINRPKWPTKHRNIQINDLVIIKADNEAPTKWKMGRVIDVYPDPNGMVRSAKIRTHNGEIASEYTRPITKLGLLLPATDNDSANDDQI